MSALTKTPPFILANSRLGALGYVQPQNNNALSQSSIGASLQNQGSRAKAWKPEFIIHTKEPRFIAKIFNPETEAEAKEIKDKITLHTEIDFKGRTTIIGIIELWEPKVSEDKLRAVIKRLKHWYCSILNEPKL